ncbi:MAG TPA: hypothetical protein VHM90_22110 [Phycisphaerae bacterium]|jgi:hypothetical protein|nr:hypothetical protein [Phycisphaerae bacterium]
MNSAPQKAATEMRSPKPINDSEVKRMQKTVRRKKAARNARGSDLQVHLEMGVI